VKELQDTQGSEYFKFLSRKAHEGASNQAKVDVANARMIGETGEAEKRGETRQKISKIDAQTAVLETQRKSEKAFADAELTNTQTKLNMGINLANIEASRQAEAKDAELQREVEIKRAEMELEKRRATEVVHAKIERESAQEKADARLYADTKGADGLLYKQKLEVEASYYRATKEAEAAFFTKRKEAEGLTAMAEAYGQMADVLGGPSGYADPSPLIHQASTNVRRLMQYLMLQNNTYEKLAKANATAINGLQPKITVWNTGEGASSDSTAPIRNLLQSLPPLLSTINEQTGIAPPSWLAQMPAANQTPAPSQALTSSAKPKTNGVYVNGDAHGSK
jgi:flotillin